MEKLKYVLLLVLFGLICFTSYDVFCVEPQTLFHQANAAYADKDYQRALDIYHQIVGSGFDGGELRYNIANCYLKLNDKFRAILNYERANLFLPNDPDILHNLEYIRNDLVRSYEESRPYWLRKIIKDVLRGFNISFLAVLLTITNVCVFLLIGLRVYKIKSLPLWPIFLSVVFVLFFTAEILLRKIEMAGAAMIIEEAADVRYEPNDKATVYFSVNGGEKIKILRTESEWIKIERPDGKKGWTLAALAERI